MTAPRLKSCPFCGNDPGEDSPFELYCATWAVECQHCFAQGPTAEDAEVARLAWNGRAEK